VRVASCCTTFQISCVTFGFCRLSFLLFGILWTVAVITLFVPKISTVIVSNALIVCLHKVRNFSFCHCSGASLNTMLVMVRFVAGIFLSLTGKCVDILPASKNRYEVQSVSDVKS